jgi:hypothetical protein
MFYFIYLLIFFYVFSQKLRKPVSRPLQPLNSSTNNIYNLQPRLFFSMVPVEKHTITIRERSSLPIEISSFYIIYVMVRYKLNNLYEFIYISPLFDSTNNIRIYLMKIS